MAEKDELRVPLSYIDTAQDDKKGGKTGETAITIEPLNSREAKGHKTEDTLSSISEAPTVEHYNISLTYRKTFREHEGATAGPKTADLLQRVYDCTLTCAYNFCLYLCGFLMACVWGVINGLVAFLQTWFISPASRILLVLLRGLCPIICEPLRICLKICIDAKAAWGGITGGVGGAFGLP